MKYKGNPKYNSLRHIIRNAQNATKQLEWDDDLELSRAANIQWNKLEKIFRTLGIFPEDK